LDIFDVFTSSGIVARHCKQFSHSLLVNDLERYAAVTAECYLSNKDELNILVLNDIFNGLLADINNNPLELERCRYWKHHIIRFGVAVILQISQKRRT
jgi:adenine-specific DNA-methyltransferase